MSRLEQPKIVDTGLKMDLHRMSALSVVRRIIIHHTVANDQSAAQINHFHMTSEKRKWAGIGYHFLIRYSGVIEQGRPLDKQGVHTANQNFDSIGVALNGDFTKEDPLARINQYNSAVRLVAWLLVKFGLSVGAISMHKNYSSTACPGNFPFDKFKKDVSDLMGSSDKYVYYTVVRGDTLGKLAVRFDTTVEWLAKANGIVNVDLIREGDVLIVAEKDKPDYSNIIGSIDDAIKLLTDAKNLLK
jgi:LysM repeat protein